MMNVPRPTDPCNTEMRPGAYVEGAPSPRQLALIDERDAVAAALIAAALAGDDPEKVARLECRLADLDAAIWANGRREVHAWAAAEEAAGNKERAATLRQVARDVAPVVRHMVRTARRARRIARPAARRPAARFSHCRVGARRRASARRLVAAGGGATGDPDDSDPAAGGRCVLGHRRYFESRLGRAFRLPANVSVLLDRAVVCAAEVAR